MDVILQHGVVSSFSASLLVEKVYVHHVLHQCSASSFSVVDELYDEQSHPVQTWQGTRKECPVYYEGNQSLSVAVTVRSQSERRF